MCVPDCAMRVSKGCHARVSDHNTRISEGCLACVSDHNTCVSDGCHTYMCACDRAMGHRFHCPRCWRAPYGVMSEGARAQCKKRVEGCQRCLPMPCCSQHAPPTRTLGPCHRLARQPPHTHHQLARPCLLPPYAPCTPVCRTHHAARPKPATTPTHHKLARPRHAAQPKLTSTAGPHSP